jgi:CTD kinase subunit gamma
MDPFQIRLECVALLRRLTASQQSISKVVDYAIRYATTASDDIWDCIVSECSKTTLNARLNILFLVDALLLQIVDPIGFSASSTGSSSSSSLSTVNLAQAAMAYLALAVRDIRKVILQGVVPSDNWDAVRLNASSTEKVRFILFEFVGEFD